MKNENKLSFISLSFPSARPLGGFTGNLKKTT